MSNKIFDTSSDWLFLSTLALVTTILAHAIANGWIGPWLGHNWYNDPRTAWIGTYPVNIMHFLAGFSLAAVIFNLNLGRLKRSYILVPILLTLVIAQNIGLLWEWLELFVYGRNPHGFIQVSLLDALFDQTMDLVGAVIAVLVGERFVA